MNRLLLALVVLLTALLAAGRTARQPDRPARIQPPVARVRPVQATARGRPPSALVLSGTSAPLDVERSPILARLARTEARRRLAGAGTTVYLDSLFTTGDSVVRRWSDRAEVRIAIGRPPENDALVDEVRAAIGAWDGLRFGVGIRESADSATAEIVVTWIDRFGPGAPVPGTSSEERTGLTELRTGPGGEVQHVRVWLALSDVRGRRLGGGELRGVAMHELGHALGLPHSADEGDIMYPTVTRPQLSDRDRLSTLLLYSLPPGPLREPPAP